MAGKKKKHTQGKSVMKAVQAQEGKYPDIPGDKVFQGGMFSLIRTARHSRLSFMNANGQVQKH